MYSNKKFYENEKELPEIEFPEFKGVNACGENSNNSDLNPYVSIWEYMYKYIYMKLYMYTYI